MPVLNGRLTCCVCGSDLGDAEDPYRDPSCEACDRQAMEAEAQYEDERDQWLAQADQHPCEDCGQPAATVHLISDGPHFYCLPCWEKPAPAPIEITNDLPF